MSKLAFSVDKIETTDNKKDSIDNLQDAQSYISLKGLQDLFKYIYPVNSIYISYSHTYPGDLFGGTWERIENTFLWCLDANGEIGQTGGETTHTLTVDEMPSHEGHLYANETAWVPNGPDSYYMDTTHNNGLLQKYNNRPYIIVAGNELIIKGFNRGGSQPHNNMPPYIQVSAWRRTEL